MKKIISILLVFIISLSMLFVVGCEPDHDNERVPPYIDYTEIEKDFLKTIDRVFKNYQLYDARELPPEILETRTPDTIIIERCVGQVSCDTPGEEYGVVLNAYDNDYNYISYQSCPSHLNLHKGTIVVSYMIYNPFTNYTDDIVSRFDFVARRDFESNI